MKLYERIILFYYKLDSESFNLPLGYEIINPYIKEQKEQVKKVSSLFYQKYYNDDKARRIIFGSSPSRRGSAVTGVPFEDAVHLQNETGIHIDNFYISKSSSGFLYEVMERYGGCNKFYGDFYMSFICPLGIVKINSEGKEINCNYYENKKLQDSLETFIVRSIQKQLEFNIDTSVCYCIGSGENYKFLLELNKKYRFFKTIIPLEHPRFIMQYNKHRKEEFIDKYLNALENKV